MFRGSAYSIQTDKDNLNKSQLLQQQIRVAIIGVSDVGKSSMLACIQNQKFRQDINNTKGIQLRFKKLRMNNYVINLYVWDGPGDHMQEMINDGQFNDKDAILQVFDLTDKQSFHQLQHLHYQLKKYFNNISKELCAVLVGNKADAINMTYSVTEISKQINYMADSFAKRQEMLYLKVSAKHNSSVKDSFIQLIKQVLVGRCKGKNSRIFGDDQQIGVGVNSVSKPPVGCSCCKTLKSSCLIF